MALRASSTALLVLLVPAAAALAACGDGGGGSGAGDPSGTSGSGAATGAGGDGTGAGFTGSGGGGTGGMSQPLEVEPAAPRAWTAPLGSGVRTSACAATANGQPANAGWQVSQGNIGAVSPGPSSTTTFTPTGTTGGAAKGVAGLTQKTAPRAVFVMVVGEPNR